jgi:hypothetical protein
MNKYKRKELTSPLTQNKPEYNSKRLFGKNRFSQTQPMPETLWEKPEPTTTEHIRERGDFKECMFSQLVYGIGRKRLFGLKVRFDESTPEDFFNLVKTLFQNKLKVDVKAPDEGFNFGVKCEVVSKRNQAQVKELTEDLIKMNVPVLERTLKTFRNIRNPVDGYFLSKSRYEMHVLFFMAYEKDINNLYDIQAQFLKEFRKEFGLSSDNIEDLESFFEMKFFTKKYFQRHFEAGYTSKCVQSFFRKKYKTMENYVLNKFRKSQYYQRHKVETQSGTPLSPLLQKRNSSEVGLTQSSMTKKKLKPTPVVREPQTILKTPCKIKKTDSFRNKIKNKKEDNKHFLEELNKFVRFNRASLGKRKYKLITQAMEIFTLQSRKDPGKSP